MEDVAAVSFGYDYTFESRHTMVIKTDGTLWAWGNNEYGQLGDGTTTDRFTPVMVLDDVVSVSAYNIKTMAIRADGSLWAWGSNWGGQLGDGTSEHRYSPVRIMEDVAAVKVGINNSFAIRNDGSLWAWGGNWVGTVGDGTNIDRQTPVMIMSDVAAVSVDRRFIAGVGGSYGNRAWAIKTDGSMWGWGANIIEDTLEESPVMVMENIKLPALI